jgi:hypothetical protein
MNEHHDLETLLARISAACVLRAHGRVSVGDILKALGNRSFGPLLLIPGLIGLSPIGAIPGLPAVTSAIVMVVSAQILAGVNHARIPGLLARRSIEADRLKHMIEAIQPWARFADRIMAPRWTFFTTGPFFYLLTVLCLMVAAVTPIIEIVPLAGIVPNAAIVAFGLAITTHDGLWAILALLFTGASVYLISLAF